MSPNQALQQTAGHDSFLGLPALRCPAAAELGCSAREGTRMPVQAFYLDIGGSGLTPLDSFTVTGHEFVLVASSAPLRLDDFVVTDMNGFLYLCQGTSIDANWGGQGTLVRIEGLVVGKSQLPRKDQAKGSSPG
jgi:hypothetical protein